MIITGLQSIPGEARVGNRKKQSLSGLYGQCRIGSHQRTRQNGEKTPPNDAEVGFGGGWKPFLRRERWECEK